MIDRMIRAARLDSSLYEEAEHDLSLTGEALRVVVLVALLGGLGALLDHFVSGGRGGLGGALFSFLVYLVQAVVGWGIWAWLTYFIGTRVFHGTATWGELLRTIGYAYSPHVLDLFRFIPCLGPLLFAIAWIWSVVAGVVAVRQALDFDTGKAIGTVVIGWIIQAIVTGVVLLISGGAAAIGRAIG